MKLYNTMTSQKEEFVPLKNGEISMYVCGPTVYNFIHIGNARTFITFDVVRKYFEYKGYMVKYVQNFTDIDDKMIKKANEERISVKELGDRFINEYITDAKALGIKEATYHPRATENINTIIDFIKKLIDKGFAYVVNGDVYYDVSKFKGYGKLSNKKVDELKKGARVDVNDLKDDPMDFALWKAQKPGEPAWDSPWGYGRPGWHIECSAMANSILGHTIDIHAGGPDLIFPHHENEIAQSEAANGCVFANYWMHIGYLNINNEKMSKSKNNFFTVRELTEKYSPELLRYFMLTSHYRSPINFSVDLLSSAQNGLERLINGYKNLKFYLGKAEDGEFSVEEKQYLDKINEYKKKFLNSMDDDFNTADAIAAIFEIIRESNSFVNKDTHKKAIESTVKIIEELTSILGILKIEEELLDSDIEDLIEQRLAARKNKNYALADQIRDNLKSKGIILEDTPSGVRWKRV